MAESDLKDDHGAPPNKRRKPDEPSPLETPVSETAGIYFGAEANFTFYLVVKLKLPAFRPRPSI